MKILTPTPIRFPQLAALLLLGTIFAAPSAYAQAIKMLPPTNCPNVTVGPTQANVWGVLGWDSKSPLSCIPNFTFANNGYTGLGSQVSPQALLDLFGDYNYSYPSPGTGLPLGNAHLQPLDSANPSSTAITFGGTPTGAVNAQGVNEYDGYAEAGIYVQYQLSNPAYPNGATKMYFGTTNNYLTGPQIHLAIDNNGNVGIGTTIPAAALDVNGAMRATGSTNPLIGGVPTSTPIVLGNQCTPHGAIAYDMSSNDQPVYCNSSGVWTTAWKPENVASVVVTAQQFINYAPIASTAFSVTITPNSTSSQIEITLDTLYSIVGDNSAYIWLYRSIGGSAPANLMSNVGPAGLNYWARVFFNMWGSSGNLDNGNAMFPMHLTYVDLPNTTSPVTYTVYIGVDKNTSQYAFCLVRRCTDSLYDGPGTFIAKEL